MSHVISALQSENELLKEEIFRLRKQLDRESHGLLPDVPHLTRFDREAIKEMHKGGVSVLNIVRVLNSVDKTVTVTQPDVNYYLSRYVTGENYQPSTN